MENQKKCRFDQNTLYSELKEFFSTAELPERLTTEDYYFQDVKFTVKMLMQYIDGIIDQGLKPNDHSKHCKIMLILIANHSCSYITDCNNSDKEQNQ